MFDAADFDGPLTPIERRGHRRQRTLLTGKLLFRSSGQSNDCTIRNLSTLGAKLSGRGLEWLPDDPILVVTKTGLAHDAVRVWRRGVDLGVRFRHTYDLREAPPPQLAQAHRLWVESLLR